MISLLSRGKNSIHQTVLEYVNTDNDPNLFNYEMEELTKLPSELKPTLLVDVILMKV